MLVDIEHRPGLHTRYGGLSTASVKRGDKVAAGQAIGRVAPDGPVHEPRLLHVDGVSNPSVPVDAPQTKPHLHFELYVWEIVRDPLQFFCPRAGCMKVHDHGSWRALERNMPEWPLTQACK